MALLNETFYAATLPQNTSSFDPLPKGWYSATIAGAELKTTKNGTGQYIAVRYDIIGPTHQGRVVFGNLNIRNQNIKAEEIGRAQLFLSGLCDRERYALRVERDADFLSGLCDRERK